MIKFIKSSKSLSYSSYDYTFSEVDELFEVSNYLWKKIQGRWELALIKPDLNSITKVIKQWNKQYVDLHIITDDYTLDQVMRKHDITPPEKLTKYDEFLKRIAEKKIFINRKEAREFYRRIGGVFDQLEEYLLELSKYKEITMEAIKEVVKDDSVLYASEVIRDYIEFRNYREYKLKKLISNLGVQYAYNALRASVRSMINDKSNYLDLKEPKYWFTKDLNSNKLALLIYLFTKYNYIEIELLFKDYERRF